MNDSRARTGKMCFSSFRIYASNVTIVGPRPILEDARQGLILGMVLIAVLSFLHARFVWFPLGPIGYLIGTTSSSALFGLWAPFLVAWILKTITFRVGGAKMFESRGLPIASGAVTGCVIVMLLSGVLFIIRFFVPF